MHELGICDALLKMVDSVAKDEELECVKKVTVEVGTLSGVIPAYLSGLLDGRDGRDGVQDTRFVVETRRVRRAALTAWRGVHPPSLSSCAARTAVERSSHRSTGRDLTLKEIEAY